MLAVEQRESHRKSPHSGLHTPYYDLCALSISDKRLHTLDAMTAGMVPCPHTSTV